MLAGEYRYPQVDGVVFGRPWADTVAQEAGRLGSRRIFALVGNSLAAALGLEDVLRAALGERFAGIAAGIRAHSPRVDVAAAAAAAHEAGADLIVAIGGGSVIDAAKVMQLCLAAGVYDAAGFDALRGRGQAVHRIDLPVRVIAVPSTLSGAELTAFAGVTDTSRNRKEMYLHPQMSPRLVVLDPAVTVHTPADLWLSTGIRAVDHAVEDICSINSQPLADAVSLHALRLFAEGLPRCKDRPDDLDARLRCLIGVWLSMIGTQGGVEKGASHAIGHILGGSYGVPHGYTSCVTLPHVLRWNKPVNSERQTLVSEALGAPGADAGDAVAALIARLELPRTLRDVGVHRDQLKTIAELTMDDPWTPTNPRPVNGPGDILEILERAW